MATNLIEEISSAFIFSFLLLGILKGLDMFFGIQAPGILKWAIEITIAVLVVFFIFDKIFGKLRDITQQKQ